jgi:hypothetical protein
MTPSLWFRGQPFRDEDTAGAFLAGALTRTGVSSLTIVVAWARFGGLRRFKAELEAFRNGGGELRVVLGIDEEVATRPGLMLAVDLATRAYVFHDRQARTFHLKLYLAEGPDMASLLVGSSNMTAGGLFSNYEASLEAEFELPGEETAEALVGARGYVTKLLEDEELCLPLDHELVERLVADPRYAVSARERRQRKSPEPPPEGIGADEADQEGQTGEPGEDIFGTSQHDKATARWLPSGAREELEELEAEIQEEEVEAPGHAEPAVDIPLSTGPDPTPVEIWTKKLPASDAQQPPSPNSNPLGNLRLTKSSHEIEWLTWFREEMFGAENWTDGLDRMGNPIQTATVSFAVTIDGQSHGSVDLVVDHAAHREEEQSNHATVLHWGTLLPILRESDYTGYMLTIQRMADGSFRLDLSP